MHIQKYQQKKNIPKISGYHQDKLYIYYCKKCIQLLSIENPSLLRKLSCYVHKAFDIRTSSICVNILTYFSFICLHIRLCT